MRHEKRLWIYSGLAVPQGVALVSQPVKRVSRPSCALMAGNDSPGARALQPALAKILSAARIKLFVDLRPGTDAHIWASYPWLRDDLHASGATVVLMALEPSDHVARYHLDKVANDEHAIIFWLVRHGLFGDNLISAPHSMDANGIAEWCGKIWNAIS